MVKQLQQRYTYNGRQYTLPGLKKFVDFSSAGNIFGSLVVTTKTGILVKIPVRSHPCFVMLFSPAGIAIFIYFEFRPKLFVFPFQLRNTWR